jgi:ribonuclease J
MITLHLWDGVNCIGGNKIVLEDEAKDQSLLMDFGKNFGEENKYFDEFLQPRSRFGIYDLLRMNFLPPALGLYRPDLLPPNLGYVSCKDASIKPAGGVLISHAHLDHIGYVSYLREDLTIIASTISGALMKSLQDTNRQLYSELVSVSPKEVSENGTLKPAKGAPMQPRPFVLMQSPTSVAQFTENVWNASFLKKPHVESEPVYALDHYQIAGFNIRCWPVDHSIPGAMAYAVETSQGWIVYTGDLRLHGSCGALTRKFFEEAAKLEPLALICEGTHPEEINPVTEQQVEERSLDVAKKTNGLVIADFGARNVERLISFLRIARETQRYLVLTPKDFLMLEYLNYSQEDFPNPMKDPNMLLYTAPKSRTDAWEEYVISTVSEEKKVQALQIHLHPEEYILCFSYYDFANLLDIDVHGGAYIYSSSEPFNEEMALDHQKIRNWIDLFGYTVYGRLGQVPNEQDDRDPFHASGHIHSQGLIELIETIKPRYLIPVHTEKPEFFQQFQGFSKVITPFKGQTLQF